MRDKIRRDILWKGIIEDFFEDFLKYFYPDDYHIFDLSKGFEFLDKELEQIIIPSSNKNRVADKLVKVHTIEGEEKWVLIHLEVQGYEDKEFSERMFVYYYRIFDRYKKRIGALALFTDDKASFRPYQYQSSFLETNIDFSYKIIKLSDYKAEDFGKSNNPFDIVMEVAWYGLKKNKLSDENLFSVKLDLARKLHERGFSKTTFGKICSFIKKYISFEKSELISKLDEEIDSINEIVRPMGILEAIEQEVIRQTTVRTERRVTRQVTQQVTQQVLKNNINKLYQKGFSVESIAEMLELEYSFVKDLIQ